MPPSFFAMIDLPDITLCAVDCVNPVLALRALDISMQQCRFGECLFLSDSADQFELPGCRMVPIPRIASRGEYSRFVIKDLGRYLKTTHMMLIQWDGYVINGDAWRKTFLDFDYIGAPWGFHSDGHRIGNGGFSLRSRRLFDALADPQVTELDPEDQAIGRRYRPLLEDRHGIRFPDEDLARSFSYETLAPNGRSFGFHGLANLWMVVPPDQLPEFVAFMSPGAVKGPAMIYLAKNYLKARRRDLASIVLKRRLELSPDDSEAQGLLASARNQPDVSLDKALADHQAGRLDAAEAGYRQVLATDAGNAMAKHYLGVLMMQRGDPRGGETLIREAIAALPDIPDFHNNLGLCLRLLDRPGEAVTAYRRALALKADYAPAHNNLGLDLQSLGDVGAAAAHFEQAIATQPAFAEAHWNLGLALLTLGEFARGWSEYEWRLRCQPFADDGLNLTGVAPWQGEPLNGKTLLIRREQGAGDTIQFARFIPELGRRGARVLLSVRPELARLVRSVSPDVELVDTAPVGKIDYFVNLLSLPHRLSVTLDDLPATPYLHPEESKTALWRQRLSAYPGRRIGLVWGGNPRHKNDRNRSCPLATLRPLLDLPGITWFSLQKGEPAGQLSASEGLPIIDLGPELNDYSDTAAALQALDLLISVDTSVAHLAGALARPTWLLLPFAPDWRWLLEREDSPWYPTLRLLRQRSPRDWRGVVERLRIALSGQQETSDAQR